MFVHAQPSQEFWLLLVSVRFSCRKHCTPLYTSYTVTARIGALNKNFNMQQVWCTKLHSLTLRCPFCVVCKISNGTKRWLHATLYTCLLFQHMHGEPQDLNTTKSSAQCIVWMYCKVSVATPIMRQYTQFKPRFWIQSLFREITMSCRASFYKLHSHPWTRPAWTACVTKKQLTSIEVAMEV